MKRSSRLRKKYQLRLFIAGATQRSMNAIQNVRQLCEQQLPGRYQLEIIDIYQQPARARAEQIIATPTLVKQAPQPIRRFIGDLSDATRLLQGINYNDPDKPYTPYRQKQGGRDE